MLSELGLAVNVKSETLTVTVAECTRVPLVPVTFTVYVPPLPVQLREPVPEPPAIVAGLTLHVRPVLGEIVVVRVTVPVKLLIGITSIVVVPFTPGVVLTVVGLTNIWKLTTWTLMVAVVCESDPLVPVTVTV
jgi:hypothetical protein